jgi:hypothetical protein
VPGIVELLGVSILVGIFNLMNSIFGMLFVVRNKLDIPKVKDSRKYEKLYSKD